jgi:hypothetical protein
MKSMYPFHGDRGISSFRKLYLVIRNTFGKHKIMTLFVVAFHLSEPVECAPTNSLHPKPVDSSLDTNGLLITVNSPQCTC